VLIHFDPTQVAIPAVVTAPDINTDIAITNVRKTVADRLKRKFTKHFFNEHFYFIQVKIPIYLAQHMIRIYSKDALNILTSMENKKNNNIFLDDRLKTVPIIYQNAQYIYEKIKKTASDRTQAIQNIFNSVSLEYESIRCSDDLISEKLNRRNNIYYIEISVKHLKPKPTQLELIQVEMPFYIADIIRKAYAADIEKMLNLMLGNKVNAIFSELEKNKFENINSIYQNAIDAASRVKKIIYSDTLSMSDILDVMFLENNNIKDNLNLIRKECSDLRIKPGYKRHRG
jgi:DNA polymerase III delta prime subunit